MKQVQKEKFETLKKDELFFLNLFHLLYFAPWPQFKLSTVVQI